MSPVLFLTGWGDLGQVAPLSALVFMSLDKLASGVCKSQPTLIFCGVRNTFSCTRPPPFPLLKLFGLYICLAHLEVVLKTEDHFLSPFDHEVLRRCGVCWNEGMIDRGTALGMAKVVACSSHEGRKGGVRLGHRWL